jgi:DNA-binding LacI/PurR family transcriptional regulator
MACADERSERVLQGCKAAGLTIPNQIGIIGADFVPKQMLRY